MKNRQGLGGTVIQMRERERGRRDEKVGDGWGPSSMHFEETPDVEIKNRVMSWLNSLSGSQPTAL